MAPENKTILVVDDEPDVRTYISTLLEDNGFSVVTANDGGEAVEQVEKHHPDLITLDITMPEKSGVRFYRDMKENQATKDLPIVIVSGISEDFERFICIVLCYNAFHEIFGNGGSRFAVDTASYSDNSSE